MHPSSPSHYLEGGTARDASGETLVALLEEGVHRCMHINAWEHVWVMASGWCACHASRIGAERIFIDGFEHKVLARASLAASCFALAIPSEPVLDS